MTRRFLDDVRNDSANLLVTNGDVTGPQLNALLQDVIDSSIQDECSISRNEASPPIDVNTTNSWQKVNTTVYEQDEGGDGSFLKPNFSAGEIETSSTPGFSYEIGALVSFEGGNQDRYDFTILRNGVPEGVISSVTGQGGNDPVTSQPRDFVRSAGADDVFSLGVRSGNANDTIEVISCVLYVVIQPTNNP